MSEDEKKFDRIRLGFQEEDSKMEMEDFVCLEEVDLRKLLEVTKLMSDRGILRRRTATRYYISHHFIIISVTLL
jgi:hypothetical protein